MSGASKILIGSGAVGDPVDDEFDNVSFLSHFDGANNGTNIAYDDGSASNHTVSVTGNVTQGTFGPFARPDGEWSTYIGPGAGSSSGAALHAASSSDFTLDGEYTIEFFVNLTSTAAQYFFAIGDTSNANDMELGLASGTTLRLYQGGYKTFSTGSELTVNTWHHVAVTRNGSDLVTCWVDGTALGTTHTLTADADGTATVGATFYSTSYYNSCLGYISNFRILNGTCLYTSNFTPPTSALTAITNTKLLTCQSNRFVDNSASAHAITVVQLPKASAFTPILTSEAYDSAVNGASAYFNNGSLDIGSNADFDYGTGDFTWECWYYLSENTSHSNYIMNQGTYLPALSNQSDNTLDYANGTAYEMVAAVAPQKQWGHVAVSRSSGTTSLYYNGIRTNTFSDSIDYVQNAHRIGLFTGSGYGVVGYISDVRILKGQGLYSGTTLTVPTAPLANITNTVLLLNMADGQALDSAAQNNMPLYGNAVTSTAQKKFGTASLLLDGTGDYAQPPIGNVVPFGTGDFTVECFVNFDNIGQDAIFSCREATGSSATGFMFTAYSSKIQMYTAGGFQIDGGTTISTTGWYHVALSRASGTTKMFVNGTQVGSDYSDSNNYTSTVFQIGYDISGSYGLDGSIDELRVSHMARYTSNFTPATEAFPDKGQ